MRRRVTAISAIVCLAVACSATQPAVRTESRSPSYSAAQIYKLKFKGVSLGMTFQQVCATLTGQGFVRRPTDGTSPPCDPARLNPIMSDDYFGAAVFQDWRHPRPSPTDKIHHISVMYDELSSAGRVISISSHTKEPGQIDQLVEATLREWGKPTHYERHVYAVLNYASAPIQADPMNIQRFLSCRVDAKCTYARDKTDCGAILQNFAGPSAGVVAYEWGRSVRIEDQRHAIAGLRASGWFERREWEQPDSCHVPRIH